MSYTTDNLLTGIKRRGSIPTGQSRFQNAELLVIADQEIETSILPEIKAARKSYFSLNIDQAINLTNAVYRIPSRSVGAGLEAIFLVDAQGKKIELCLIDEADVYDPGVSPNGKPSYYFKGNNVVLVPPNPNTWTILRMSILIQPNQLEQTSNCALITAINSGTNTVTCSNVPTWGQVEMDLIRGEAGYECLAIDQVPTAITTGASGTIQFSSLPSDLAVGDWIALAGYSPVVQLPSPYQAILEQRTANTCLRSLGLMQQLQAGIEALKEMKPTLALISPRSQKEPQRIIPNNGLIRRR